ncbi:Pkinase-domain-containing protein [Punctularia strigosozonata HHB-11173 SS5]|uniref:Pkinase-domain-containing protein n=1 Tax=Punctularia strigosozonata (strain HHB-11173) TaxID=741275 RepID=UPI0004416558|nr:Pkinase-domain-containing protein [Punctularia strigosozonata HHB-11173 SS5]EIN09886.1 Pkinase-domain-containing protein [Punctularia strigosozonata HHB-11173 SS5]
MTLQPPKSQLFRTLDNIKDLAKDALWGLSSCICKPDSSIKINGRTFKIIKVLGEGGFSFVYLAQDEASGREFALKKIRCPTGSDGVKEAMQEVEAYRRFKHKNIIRILDSAVVQDPEGEGKIVYLFLPLYKRGNFQDAINAHSAAGTHFSEKEMLRLFKGACEAVRAMHQYRPSARGATQARPAARSADPGGEILDHPDHADDDGASVPLVAAQTREEGEPIFDEDDDTQTSALNGDGNTEAGIVPYAHRDLKPGNVMIADDGVTSILMDFGSVMKARVAIENRNQALLQQDIAAEKSTMAYRAPELFDVKTGVTIDEKVDIWSLGCTLYAMAYLHSPFENLQTTEQGGSIAMAVMNAQYKHPQSSYSDGLKKLIDSMLTVDPSKRPDIDQVIGMVDRCLQSAR